MPGRISLVHTGWWICRWGWSIWYHKSQIRTSNAYRASIALPTDRHSPSPPHRPLSLTFFCCCLPISFSTMRARQIETRIVVWIIQCTSEGNYPRHSLTRPGSLLLLPTLQLLTVSNFFLYHRIRTQIDFTLACLPAFLPACLPILLAITAATGWSFANLHGTLMNQHRCGQIKNLKAVICCDIKSHVHGDAAEGRRICRKFACKIADHACSRSIKYVFGRQMESPATD